MQKISPEFKPIHPAAWLLTACAATLLSACGGADTSQLASGQASSLLASATTTVQLDVATLPDTVAQQAALPLFHVAPVILEAPDDVDAVDNAGSIRRHAHRQSVPARMDDIATQGLTVQAMTGSGRMRTKTMLNPAVDGSAAPLAASSVVSTYSPAQIRAAYGLPSLPAAGTAISAAQAAQLGAGQTIYIVDAFHDPSVVAELAAFNQKFGLPTCTTKTIASTASLPLAAASTTAGCELAVVYNTAAGGMTATAPAYDAGWATEITLDVQWAHATAPLARIILIEAADASLNSLLGGVKLANAMGPGAVSMSFGTNEGSWTSSVDAAFAAPNMTYLAATGDSGSAVSWPAVSTNVLAVGGTSLTWSGTGSRTEAGWSGTGGGASLYTAVPSYQKNTVPGLGVLAKRSVADVAFNANPSTGQYVAVITPGSSTVNWVSAGGTSLSTPQWAGIVAIANASRALLAKPALGSPHALLYGQVASTPGTYASAFADITQGSNGTCATCTAKTGYDQPTGLGTPNVSNLISTLSGAPVAATAPVVTPASISGQAGTALSFTVSVTAQNAVTYALTGAPAGMVVSSTGAVTWATPLAGTYPVTVTAKDSKTGLSGQGLYTVKVAAQSAPVIAAASISARVGSALTFTVPVTGTTNPVTYALTGAPAGMAISTSGVVTWAKPLAGTYAVTITAKDTKTGLSGQGVITVKVATSGPSIVAPAMNGVAGKLLTGSIAISAPGATSLSVTIAGAPMGMTFSISGLTITASWASPVAGSYTLKVSVVDSLGLTAQALVPITVAAK